MKEDVFKRLMGQAKAMADEYSSGYQRGLRQHYHGEKFGEPGQHETWIALPGARGDGYRDGFAGQPPKRAPGRPTTLGAKPRNVTLDDDRVAFAKQLGDGNLSEGIRRALDLTKAQQSQQDQQA